jgi:hypothetical protein
MASQSSQLYFVGLPTRREHQAQDWCAGARRARVGDQAGMELQDALAEKRKQELRSLVEEESAAKYGELYKKISDCFVLKLCRQLLAHNFSLP